MKTVFSDISAIAHLWANKQQSEAKTSSRNFFFNGSTIYSYGHHFPIAKHITENGNNAVLFTERTYSNTTAKHIRVVSMAARHLNVIYCLNPESSHNENFAYWLRCAESEASKLIKAKKPELYLSQISRIADKVRIYANYFGLTIPAKLEAVLNIGNKAEYLDYSDKKAALEAIELKAAQKAQKAAHKKALDKWLKLETNRLYTHNGHDYLRLNNSRIETTQAVQIPLGIGKRLWQSIKDNTLQVGAKVLDYEINQVGKDIKIGCHTFTAKYLVDFGNKIFK